MATISGLLRPVKSNKVMVQSFCDILWMYANTETYFTPNEAYKKCTGEEIKIRKCDVRSEVQASGSLNTID